MRVGIQTWGTEGDVRPFFALATACGVRAASVGEQHFAKNRARIAERARGSRNYRPGTKIARAVITKKSVREREAVS